MSRRLIRPAVGAIALTAATLALSAPATGSTASAPSPAVAECDPATGAPSAARVRDDAKGAKEPELYTKNEANAYGVLKDSPLMAAGSVTIPTVFHVVSKETLSGAAATRMDTMISAQMDVLNDAFAGTTAADAADSPFRFDLVKTTHTVNPTWNTVVPGKVERDMKKALHEGDSTTLNVYVADIGGGLLQLAARVCVEHAERVFRAAQFGIVIGRRIHCSRHTFSCIRLRRIQLFMVPSGTRSRAASSL